MRGYVDVFLDVVIINDIVMNFLILLLTSKFSKIKTTTLRLFLGASVGTAYTVLLVLLPNMKVYYTTAGKVLLSMIIISVAFSPEKFINFFKALAIFYLSTFIFAGAAFAFYYFTQGGGFIRNGVFFGISSLQYKWTSGFLSIVMVGIIVKIFMDILQFRFAKDKLLIPITITFESRNIDLAALVDTGNSLHDPLSNLPVIVVEFKAIKDLLPFEIQNIFVESKENDLNSVTSIVSNSTWFSRFRLIPFTSLGMENGMLIGFKPDYIEIGEKEEKKGIDNVVVGIYNRALSKNENYKALLSPELIA